jgi:hypothetical protein
MADNEPHHEPAFPTEADIDALLDEVEGDAREAIRALLHDLAVLAADYESSVSRGYVRGEIPWLPARRIR